MVSVAQTPPDAKRSPASAGSLFGGVSHRPARAAPAVTPAVALPTAEIQRPAVPPPAADVLSFPVAEPPVAVSFTILSAAEDTRSPAKSFALGPDGVPHIDSHGAQPHAGAIQTTGLAGSPPAVLRRLGKTLDGFTSRQCLVLAPSIKGTGEHRFVMKKALDAHPGAVARTQEHFPAPAGPSLFGLDFDLKDWPAELDRRVTEAGGIAAVLRSLCPAFGDAAGILRLSSSAGVSSELLGVKPKAEPGQHRFFIVEDGRDVERFALVLHERLVLAGWSYATLTKTGAARVCSLIDVVASRDVSRLWFEGPAILGPGLMLDPGARKSRTLKGGAGLLDTPNGRLMVTMLGAIAQFERELMLERQREGIAKAKSEGKYKGRKPTARAKAADVLELKGRGMSADQIAEALGIGRSSVYRALG